MVATDSKNHKPHLRFYNNEYYFIKIIANPMELLLYLLSVFKAFAYYMITQKSNTLFYGVDIISTV